MLYNSEKAYQLHRQNSRVRRPVQVRIPALALWLRGVDMKKKIKVILGAVILAVLVCALAIVYNIAKPKTITGSKNYTVEVVDKDGASKTYEGSTDQEYLRGVMDELTKNSDFTYEGEDSEYGFMINKINGQSAVYDTDGAYWSIYVNGEYGQYGADSQPVNDGDAFKFEYTLAQ